MLGRLIVDLGACATLKRGRCSAVKAPVNVFDEYMETKYLALGGAVRNLLRIPTVNPKICPKMKSSSGGALNHVFLAQTRKRVPFCFVDRRFSSLSCLCCRGGTIHAAMLNFVVVWRQFRETLTVGTAFAAMLVNISANLFNFIVLSGQK